MNVLLNWFYRTLMVLSCFPSVEPSSPTGGVGDGAGAGAGAGDVGVEGAGDDEEAMGSSNSSSWPV